MRDSSFRKTFPLERREKKRQSWGYSWDLISDFSSLCTRTCDWHWFSRWNLLLILLLRTLYRLDAKKRERGIKYFVRDEILLSFSGEQWFFFLLLFFSPTLFLFATIWSSRSFFTISSSLLRISPFIYIHRSVYRLHVKKKTRTTRVRTQKWNRSKGAGGGREGGSLKRPPLRAIGDQHPGE